MCSLPFRVAFFPVTPFKKTNFIWERLPVGYNFQFRDRRVCLLLSALRPYVVQTLQAMCILPQFLCILMCFSHVAFRRLCFLVVLRTFWFWRSFCLLQSSLSTKGKTLMETSYFEVTSLNRFHTSCIISGCAFWYLFSPVARGSFSNDSWGRHWSMSRAEYH